MYSFAVSANKRVVTVKKLLFAERRDIMNVAMVVFGIKSILRIGHASAKLYANYSRDKAVFLPNLIDLAQTRDGQVIVYLRDNIDEVRDIPEFKACINDAGEFATTDRKVIDAAYHAMMKRKSLSSMSDYDESAPMDERKVEMENKAELEAAACMIVQWGADEEPPSAFIRLALTLADIGLEYVSANPSILGIGGSGEQLVCSFAEKMATMIPEDMDSFGAKANIWDRVLGIFLRAGLSTLTESSTLVFDDKKVADLLEGVAKPIVEALPDSIEKQANYREVVDVIAGPVATAAFRLLAENTESYLGGRFSNEKALGVVTQELFKQISQISGEHNIVEVFTKQGLVQIYKAELKVAIDYPELFIGDGTDVHSEVFKDLLKGGAQVLINLDKERLKGAVGASLMALVVETLGENTATLLRLKGTEFWDKVAIKTIEQVAGSLSDALNQATTAGGKVNGALQSFADGQLIELVRIVIQQAAKTPGMLGVDKVELQSIIAGVASAMASDDNLLLSPDEWVVIAGVVAREAAANPGRLFGLDANDPEQALAVTAIKTVLATAASSWHGGRGQGILLFGETLLVIVESLLKALAGNIEGISSGNMAPVDGFLNKLMDMASQNPNKFGSQGFLNVFQALIGEVIAKGQLPDDEKIREILEA